MQHHLIRMAAASLFVTTLGTVATAQTAAAGGTGKLQSLGSANPKAPTMSREELRTCLNQQAELKNRATKMAEQRAALDAERKMLEQENESLKLQHKELAERARKTTEELNSTVAAHTEQVQKFNEKMDALNAAMKRGENVDRRRSLLEREGVQIQKVSDDLNVRNSAAMADLETQQKALNARLADFDARTDNWNARNAPMNSLADSYTDDLTSWKTVCGGRNFRESDEQAIRAGK